MVNFTGFTNKQNSKKKGLISLEALIIFIAVILIAAISAGVLIRNSGILSQRALSVGEESRERLISGVEILSMTGTASIADEEINDIELLLRLKPGSLPVQLKNLRVLFSTADYSAAATMQIASATDKVFENVNVNYVNTSSQDLVDASGNGVDMEKNANEQGTATEHLWLDNSTGTWRLVFNLSYASNNDDPDNGAAPALAYVNLGTATLASGTVVSVIDHAVTENGAVYGYVNIAGTINTNNTLSGTTATLSNFQVNPACSFSTLIPEKRFCIEDSIGNGDTTLGQGEIIIVRFKFKPQNALKLQSYYSLQLIPKDAAIEKLSANTPSTVVVEKVTLWG